LLEVFGDAALVAFEAVFGAGFGFVVDDLVTGFLGAVGFLGVVGALMILTVAVILTPAILAVLLIWDLRRAAVFLLMRPFLTALSYWDWTMLAVLVLGDFLKFLRAKRMSFLMAAL